MKSFRFRRIGIFFIPVSFPSWVVLFAVVGYAVYVFIDIDSRSHSVSDTMINFVFNLMIIGGIYSVIGFLTSLRS
ncbi:MAG: hypothetical protein WBP41_09515 [Saprospiraceae bacterium]